MTNPPENFRARGSRHGAAKLTEADVREIRRRYATGRETFAVLASAFSVSPQSVSGVVHMRSWRHVEEKADDLTDGHRKASESS